MVRVSIGFFRSEGANHLEISDLTILGGSTSESGGGISIEDSTSSVTAEYIIVSNNFAAKGAGIANSGTLNLTDVSINDNGTTGGTSEGGGLHNKRDAFLDRVTISDNSAQRGGGIHHDNNGGFMTLTNVTVSGNTASVSGGGLYSRDDAVVQHSTFTNNSADQAGGIRVKSGDLDISNTIVAGNSATSSHTDVRGSYISYGFNLIGDVDSATGFGSGLGASDLLNVSASLDPLTDNGAFGWTHALQAGSLAINAGSVINGASIDQSGGVRSAIPDIGAMESNTETGKNLLDRIGNQLDPSRQHRWHRRPSDSRRLGLQ